jgi:hypothetical protein
MLRDGMATGSTRETLSDCPGRSGEHLLKTLAPELEKRGVQSSSFVMIDIGSGEFVTGRTREEALQRFDMLHPNGIGCVSRVSDLFDQTPTDRMIRGHAGVAPRYAARTPASHKKSKRPAAQAK